MGLGFIGLDANRALVQELLAGWLWRADLMACFSANFFLIRNAIDLRGAGCLQKLTGGYGAWETRHHAYW